MEGQERRLGFNDLKEMWGLERGENNGNLSSCVSNAQLRPASVLETGGGDQVGLVTTDQ